MQPASGRLPALVRRMARMVQDGAQSVGYGALAVLQCEVSRAVG